MNVFLKKTKFFPPQQHSKKHWFLYFEGIIAIAIFPHDFSPMCINIQLKNFLKGYLHIEWEQHKCKVAWRRYAYKILDFAEYPFQDRD